MFDLSQFEKVPVFSPDNQIGIVLSLSLAEVIEDPTQPRTEFDSEELAKLAADIGHRGVQSPIAVRPPIDGVYQIIHGARRFRASGLAGLHTIPAIVQSDEVAFDDYSQVLENTQRDSLTPLDIARFIQKRKVLGESNSQIARNLSEKPEWVTYHLALIDMPNDVQQAYDAGKVSGAKATYELRKLHSKDPEAARQLIESDEDITQVRIREVSVPVKMKVAGDKAVKPPQRSEPIPEPSIVKAEEVIKAAETKSLVSPRVIGIFQGHPVQVLVSLKPKESGYAWIINQETTEQMEVLADQITLSRIEENRP
jgi:ParB family chromosome partitioning protein